MCGIGTNGNAAKIIFLDIDATADATIGAGRFY
jgi:hypothetical protein